MFHNFALRLSSIVVLVARTFQSDFRSLKGQHVGFKESVNLHKNIWERSFILLHTKFNWRRNKYYTIIYCSFFYLLLRLLQNIQRFSASKTWKQILSRQNKSKQRIATNCHVTFRFLNFRVTFSLSVSGLGSIVTAIILELIFLWRNCIWKWTKTKEKHYVILVDSSRFFLWRWNGQRQAGSLQTFVRVFRKFLSSG